MAIREIENKIYGVEIPKFERIISNVYIKSHGIYRLSKEPQYRIVVGYAFDDGNVSGFCDVKVDYILVYQYRSVGNGNGQYVKFGYADTIDHAYEIISKNEKSDG